MMPMHWYLTAAGAVATHKSALPQSLSGCIT